MLVQELYAGGTYGENGLGARQVHNGSEDSCR